jgi:hypothetical protein
MLKSRFVPRDAFGLADGYPNAKLVADEWAARGYRVLLPDILGGDPMSSDMLVRAPRLPAWPDRLQTMLTGRSSAFLVNRRPRPGGRGSERARRQDAQQAVRRVALLCALTTDACSSWSSCCRRAAGKMATVGGPWVLRHREAGQQLELMTVITCRHTACAILADPKLLSLCAGSDPADRRRLSQGRPCRAGRRPSRCRRLLLWGPLRAPCGRRSLAPGRRRCRISSCASVEHEASRPRAMSY